MKLNKGQEVGGVIYFVVISEEMRYHEPCVSYQKSEYENPR
jgi:hypothetical protein